ncbi:MAG: PspC domain-containing protein [Pseudomonadota bacterium]|jgi:phage shock protein C|nr:PspC domain-containing protein [Pseudomonadota bacterium]
MIDREFWSRLRRIPASGMVAGVCAGFADYFDWNVRLIRVLVVLATIFIFGPIAFVGYAVLWYVMERGEHGDAARGDAARSNERSTRSSSPTGSGFAAKARGDARERFRRLEQRLVALEECVTSEEFELRREFRKLEA